jgi:hypothetical protein
MPYIAFDAASWGVPQVYRPKGFEPAELQGNTAMTIEILNLTAQIQRWLNARVAHYLAEQADRLPH